MPGGTLATRGLGGRRRSGGFVATAGLGRFVEAGHALGGAPRRARARRPDHEQLLELERLRRRLADEQDLLDFLLVWTGGGPWQH